MQKVELPIKETDQDKISPLKPDFHWLAIMLGFCAASIIIIVGFSQLFSRFVVSKIDIPTEREWFGELRIAKTKGELDLALLENKKAADFFADTPIYIVENETENAFASLGANIFVHTGLLQSVKNKEELLFILAHEKRHIENRDVLVSFSKELPIQITLESLGLNFGNQLIDTNKILSSFYSREHEFAADQGGIELLNSLSLNTKCATGFFDRTGSDFEKYTQIVSTHPESKKRAEIINQASKFPDKECSKWEWKENNNNIEK